MSIKVDKAKPVVFRQSYSIMHEVGLEQKAHSRAKTKTILQEKNSVKVDNTLINNKSLGYKIFPQGPFLGNHYQNITPVFISFLEVFLSAYLYDGNKRNVDMIWLLSPNKYIIIADN